MFHGNIDMDCDYFIKTYGDAALDNAVHWATRNKSVGNNYGIDQEVYDIVRSGGDPEGKIYGRANMFTDPKAISLAEGLLGLYDYELKLHYCKTISGKRQAPGGYAIATVCDCMCCNHRLSRQPNGLCHERQIILSSLSLII